MGTGVRLNLEGELRCQVLNCEFRLLVIGRVYG